MLQYAKISVRLAQQEHEDPVYAEEYNYDQDAHPRSVLTIRRSNGIPFPYLTNTVIDILTKGDGNDPFSRTPFSELTKERAFLYKLSMEKFPDIRLRDLDVKKIFLDWEKDCQEKKYTFDIHLKAKVFLQTEDLLTIFQQFQGKGSMLNRMSAEEYLEKNDKTWLIRNSSLIDTEYDRAYTLTIKHDTGKYTHSLIIHKIGEGVYYNAEGVRGCPIPKVFKYLSCYPSIIELIENIIYFNT